MLKHRLYYLLKPYLPWVARMAVRRIAAQRTLALSGHIWPVNPDAAQTPPGWPGWPGGKRFAVVLTHDVEGPRGLTRCASLADVEAAVGFRSSFNFIPEGPYTVPEQLRGSLVRRGFEVGVHDLKHDGKLYSGRAIFRRNAARINHYLQAWNSSGFRSGFMYHNREWLHDLDVEYDASTFDTDPFEPQPDGANTIFPFWVDPSGAADTLNFGPETAPPRRNRGYVELPYTLPQDSTLFLLLKEATNSIWRNKVDWIAKHGGMVLINVHPDYLHFHTGRGHHATSILDHYTSLLRYIATEYRDLYWHALPREMAAFVKSYKDRLVPVA